MLTDQLKAAIDAVLAAGYTVKQTFLYESQGRYHASLETSYNALVNSPSISVGTFTDRAAAVATSHAAFDYAFERSKRLEGN